jgi:hypothetical protein
VGPFVKHARHGRPMGDPAERGDASDDGGQVDDDSQGLRLRKGRSQGSNGGDQSNVPDHEQEARDPPSQQLTRDLFRLACREARVGER